VVHGGGSQQYRRCGASMVSDGGGRGSSSTRSSIMDRDRREAIANDRSGGDRPVCQWCVQDFDLVDGFCPPDMPRGCTCPLPPMGGQL